MFNHPEIDSLETNRAMLKESIEAREKVLVQSDDFRMVTDRERARLEKVEKSLASALTAFGDKLHAEINQAAAGERKPLEDTLAEVVKHLASLAPENP